MNNITFNASVVNCEVNDDVIIVGFADDRFSTNQYVLLQRTLHPSRQDRELKLDGLHVEVNGSDKSEYDGIDSIRLMRDEVEIFFGAKLRNKTGLEQVKVLIDVDDQHFRHLRETLRQVVGDRAMLDL